MSTVSSCTLLSGGPAVRPANFSSGQLQSGRPAAVAPLSSQRRSRALSVCCAINPKGEHSPKTDLHPFNISPVILVHPVPPREERWQLEEEVAKVNLWFEVPGQSKEDLAVEIDEDVLVIKKKTNVGGGGMGQQTGGGTDYRHYQANKQDTTAASEASKEAAQDGEVIYARLLLPAGYSREGVEAELKSGVLKVSIAKIKEQARRKISVNIVVK
ncbi:small heat shock protein, chloroplastic-like [Phragmites australis]|uniref:small heat shock protein, chloroplastic-like n=1 Tax=Phragmites australis TaxID=29695 RepID=UPI002D77010C|nr:small heat shock protein, chloroplastic-like [Phragmites australis]